MLTVMRQSFDIGEADEEEPEDDDRDDEDDDEEATTSTRTTMRRKQLQRGRRCMPTNAKGIIGRTHVRTYVRTYAYSTSLMRSQRCYK